MYICIYIYICIWCNDENNELSRLSPQWLCGDSCTWAHEPKCMSCHKAIVVIIGKAHCFHVYIYIMLILEYFPGIVLRRSHLSNSSYHYSLFSFSFCTLFHKDNYLYICLIFNHQIWKITTKLETLKLYSESELISLNRNSILNLYSN